jgi:purine-cytosine permease-like protein
MSSQESRLPELQVTRTDDPRVVAEAAAGDYSLHAAPPTWRLSRMRLLLAWSSLATGVFWFYLAALVALLVGTTNAVIGIVLAVALFSLLGAVTSRAAAESGLGAGMFARSLFGFQGSALASLLFAATGVYFFVFESSILAVAGKAFFDGQGLTMDIRIWYLIFVVASVPLVLKGVHAWLDRLNGWLIPLYVVGMIAILVWITSDAGGYSSAWASFEPAQVMVQGPPWLFAAMVYFGDLVLVMFTMEWARLGRTTDLRFATAVTFGPVFYVVTFLVNGLIGIYLFNMLNVKQLAEGELAASIVGVTGLLGLLWLIVTQTRINTANLYAASTGLQSVASRVLRINAPRSLWVVVAGAIGYLIMLTNVFSFIVDALQYQGIAVVSWVAMTVVHAMYLWRKGTLGRAEFRPGRVPGFNRVGLGVWILTTALGVVLKQTEPAFFATYGLLLVFGIAALLYAIGIAKAPRRWFVQTRPHDPQDEVEDPWEDRVRCHVCARSYLAREMDRDPTAEHQAICADCASSLTFVGAATAEAAKRDPAPARSTVRL